MVQLEKMLRDQDVLVVQERPVVFPGFQGGPGVNTRLLFATAGYKNSILIGTEYMYQNGHMLEFNPEDGIWYDLTYPASGHRDRGHISMYFKTENKTLYGYIGRDLPIFFDPNEHKLNVTENVLFTPLELMALNKLKKDATDVFKERLKIYKGIL